MSATVRRRAWVQGVAAVLLVVAFAAMCAFGLLVVLAVGCLGFAENGPQSLPRAHAFCNGSGDVSGWASVVLIGLPAFAGLSLLIWALAQRRYCVGVAAALTPLAVAVGVSIVLRTDSLQFLIF